MLETLHVVVALLQCSMFPFLLIKPLVFCCWTSHSFASIMQNHDPSLETNSFSSMFVASIPIFRCFKSPYLLQNPGSLIFRGKIPIFVASNPHFRYVKSPLDITFSPDYPWLAGTNISSPGFRGSPWPSPCCWPTATPTPTCRPCWCGATRSKRRPQRRRWWPRWLGKYEVTHGEY